MKKAPNRFLNLGVAAAFAVALLVAAQSRTLAHPVRHVSDSPFHNSLPTLRLNYLLAEPKWTHTLDPAFVTDATSYDILNLTQQGLVKLDTSGQAVPGLATWKVSKNHKIYWFYINKNAKFSNGDPVTAQDVVWTLTRTLLKKTGSPVGLSYDGHIVGAAALANGKATKLTGIKALNSHTVQIKVDEPIAFFLQAFTYPTADILDPKVESGKKPNSYMTDTCKAGVGTGQFRFVCRNGHTNLDSFYPSGSTPTMYLEPNPYYFGAKPKINVQIRVIPSNEVNYKQYLAGSVDMTVIPTPDLDKAKTRPDYITYPSSQIEYITPDETTAPFNDVHCRLAVSYAIDRDTINNKVLHGAQHTILDFLPKGMLGYYSGSDNPGYDPTKAKQELAQCSGGIKNVQVIYAAGSADLDNEYAAIGAMLSQVGIDVKPKSVPLNDWYNDVGQPLSKSNIKMVDNGWIEDYPDPQDYCELLLASYGTYNIGGYNSKTYDSIIKKANVTFDKSKRAALYRQAQHIALSDGADISIGNVVNHYLIKKSIHGLVGSEAYGFPVAVHDDWSRVSLGK